VLTLAGTPSMIFSKSFHCSADAYNPFFPSGTNSVQVLLEIPPKTLVPNDTLAGLLI